MVRLLRGPLPVKVVFSFREDYLGKVKELLSACPELIDQALRIAAPTADTLPTIIRGPFERYPGHFARQLSPALADRLVTVLADRFGAGDVSLSEAQTVCLRLWQSDNPEALLAEKGPQGLLEDYLGEALDGMPAQLRPAAIALLAQMVTSAGTRNVISAGDLFQRVQEQEGDSHVEPARAGARGPEPIEACPPGTPPRSRPLRDHQRVPGSLDQPSPGPIPPIAGPSPGPPSAAHPGMDRRGTAPGSGARVSVLRAGTGRACKRHPRP